MNFETLVESETADLTLTPEQKETCARMVSEGWSVAYTEELPTLYKDAVDFTMSVKPDGKLDIGE